MLPVPEGPSQLCLEWAYFGVIPGFWGCVGLVIRPGKWDNWAMGSHQDNAGNTGVPAGPPAGPPPGEDPMEKHWNTGLDLIDQMLNIQWRAEAGILAFVLEHVDLHTTTAGDQGVTRVEAALHAP